MANPTAPNSDVPVPGDAGKVQGEGDYISAKRYQQEQKAFADSGKVEAGAKAAEAALEGPEAKELERARQEAARGAPRTQGTGSDA